MDDSCSAGLSWNKFYNSFAMRNVGSNPFDASVACMFGCAGLCWIISCISGNDSQTDRLWSITPFIYAWIFACFGQFHPRLVLMAILATIWGVRLTLNFARKGGYNWKDEDYRWPYLRNNVIKNKLLYQLFRFFFICIYQHVLLLLITLPCYPVWLCRNKLQNQFNVFDVIITLLFIGFLIMETVADHQQWVFYKEKYRLKALGQTIPSNFNTKGLFAYSRHPNFFAEQSQWVCYYFFSVSASSLWINWSAVGFVLLILLFQGSTTFTEMITKSKYPEYIDYQRKTSRLVPFCKMYSGKQTKEN